MTYVCGRHVVTFCNLLVELFYVCESRDDSWGTVNYHHKDCLQFACDNLDNYVWWIGFFYQPVGDPCANCEWKTSLGKKIFVHKLYIFGLVLNQVEKKVWCYGSWGIFLSSCVSELLLGWAGGWLYVCIKLDDFVFLFFVFFFFLNVFLYFFLLDLCFCFWTFFF